MGLRTEIEKFGKRVSLGIRNIVPANVGYGFQFGSQARPFRDNDKKNLSSFLAPTQLSRTRQDVQSWRDAVREAEDPWYPFRVKMQRLFNDVVFDGHVYSCWEKRKELTLLKDFWITDDKGNDYEEVAQMFKDKVWFKNILNWALDAKGFGYSLIALGDLVGNDFPEPTVVRRRNISPDRLNVAIFENTVQGELFLEDPYKDWHIWVPTPGEIGESRCGYGLFYRVALYQILLRGNLGQNADFNELFGVPIRWGKTTKTEEGERAALFNNLLAMGGSAVIVTDPDDDLQILEPKGGSGKGFETFSNFEERLEKKISKIILGHADAMDSTPGQLGSKDDPAKAAMLAKEKIDTEDMENFVNDNLFPKLRKHGFKIPFECKFRFKNDKEKQEVRAVEDEQNKKTAEVIDLLTKSGYEVDDEKYLTERLGFKVKKKEVEPIEKLDFGKEIQNRLEEIYGS